MKMKLEFIKNKNGFKSYQANGFKIYYGEKNSVAGDNEVNSAEIVYLLSDKMEVIVGDKTVKYSTPIKFEIPEKTYHKLYSLSKTIFLVFN
jgi:hypothetical protein